MKDWKSSSFVLRGVLWISLILLLIPLKIISLHYLSSLPFSFTFVSPLLSPISLSLNSYELNPMTSAAAAIAPSTNRIDNDNNDNNDINNAAASTTVAISAVSSLIKSVPGMPYGKSVAVFLLILGITQLLWMRWFPWRYYEGTSCITVLALGLIGYSTTCLFAEMFQLPYSQIYWICSSLFLGISFFTASFVFLRAKSVKQGKMLVLMWLAAKPTSGVGGAALYKFFEGFQKRHEIKMVCTLFGILILLFSFLEPLTSSLGSKKPKKSLRMEDKEEREDQEDGDIPKLNNTSQSQSLFFLVFNSHFFGLTLSLSFLRLSKFFFLFWFPEFLQTVFLVDERDLGRSSIFVEYGEIAAAALYFLLGNYRFFQKFDLLFSLITGLSSSGLIYLFLNHLNASDAILTTLLSLIGLLNFYTEFWILLGTKPSRLGIEGKFSEEVVRLFLDGCAHIIVGLLLLYIFRSDVTYTWVSLFGVCSMSTLISALLLIPLMCQKTD